MIYTGLVSITFRQLSPEEIVALVAQAGLHGIEWGGDIHVPHGDVKRAREVLKMTEDAGLCAASYGSYYNVGCEGQEPITFEQVLETAAELKAPTARVWAGDRGSQDADEAWWNRVVDESRRIASLAQEAGITVSFEYHSGTLTDSSESACRLLREINHKNIRSYWQPPIGLDRPARLHGLEQVAQSLSNVHVYNWAGYDRMPLADGTEEWMIYMEYLKSLKGDRYCMLEFVKDDSPAQFSQDAQVLKHLAASV